MIEKKHTEYMLKNMLNSTSGEITFVGDFNCRNSNGQVEMDRRILDHCNGTVSGI